MYAIARVNRVFRDKQGGLIFDYLGFGRSVEAGVGDLHREWRPRRARHQYGSSGRRVVGEVRSEVLDKPKRFLSVH